MPHRRSVAALLSLVALVGCGATPTPFNSDALGSHTPVTFARPQAVRIAATGIGGVAVDGTTVYLATWRGVYADALWAVRSGHAQRLAELGNTSWLTGFGADRDVLFSRTVYDGAGEPSTVMRWTATGELLWTFPSTQLLAAGSGRCYAVNGAGDEIWAFRTHEDGVIAKSPISRNTYGDAVATADGVSFLDGSLRLWFWNGSDGTAAGEVDVRGARYAHLAADETNWWVTDERSLYRIEKDTSSGFHEATNVHDFVRFGDHRVAACGEWIAFVDGERPDRVSVEVMDRRTLATHVVQSELRAVGAIGCSDRLLAFAGNDPHADASPAIWTVPLPAPPSPCCDVPAP